jgi:hypothetical protein
MQVSHTRAEWKSPEWIPQTRRPQLRQLPIESVPQEHVGAPPIPGIASWYVFPQVPVTLSGIAQPRRSGWSQVTSDSQHQYPGAIGDRASPLHFGQLNGFPPTCFELATPACNALGLLRTVCRPTLTG